MNIADVNNAYNLIVERRQLVDMRAAPNCLLHSVGRFHDDEMIAAVLPSFAAELDKRIAEISNLITALGVDLSAEPAAT